MISSRKVLRSYIKLIVNKKFKVVYRNNLNKVILCGYKGTDLMQIFFIYAGDIPINVYFNQEWINNIPKLYE